MKWTARQIGRHLALVTLQRKCLLIVPNCNWPGSECDVLAVTENLRIIDVEIKVSRSDLRADAAKEKWFQYDPWLPGQAWSEPELRRKPRQWPARVWKHYYCMPSEIWTPALLNEIAPVSGVLLIREERDGGLYIKVERPAKPNREADRLTAEDAIDIARLASFRMWDAYKEVEALRQKVEA